MSYVQVTPRITLLIPDGWDCWIYAGVLYRRKSFRAESTRTLYHTVTRG